ncbi:MAG: hypothetical protein COA78_36930, partial [Blastopirellula sp.]
MCAKFLRNHRLLFRYTLFLLLIVLSGTSWLVQTSLAQTGTSPEAGIRFQPPQSIVLKNVHLVISADREIDSATLLVEDGRIAEIGKKIAVPDGAKVIDLKGSYVYPAFIDAMVEFDANTETYSAGHWNRSVTPQKQMNRLIKLDATKLESLRKSGIGLVLAAPKNGIIKGQSCVVTTAAGSLEKNLLRANAFQHIRLYPTRGAGGYPNSPMGAVALARQTMCDADWYDRAWQAAHADSTLGAPDTNIALLALEDAVRGRQTVVIDGTNESYALRADRFAREFSLKLIVRGSGREYRQLDAITKINRTFIIPVNFPSAPKVASRENALKSSLQSLMGWHFAPENPARLEKAGIDFVLSSDGLEKISDFLPNVRKAIKHGLSKKAALRALTERPAELLGVSHLAGTLERGKLANFLVTTGPLFDMSTKISETWVQGNRSEWNPSPETDLRGSWKLLLKQGKTKSLTLKISGTPDKLKASIGLPAAFSESKEMQTEKISKASKDPKDDNEKDEKTSEDDAAKKKEVKAGKEKPKSIELKNLVFDGYRFSGTLDASIVLKNQAGTALLSATVLPAKKGLRLTGVIHWADGSESLYAGKNTKPKSKSQESSSSEKSEEENEGDTQKIDESKKDAIAYNINYPLGAYGRASTPKQPEWLLIQGATIWTCGKAGILEYGNMLIHNGIIKTVSADEIDAPKGATIIDGTGMHVSPGIIDCHSHMATDGGVNESAQSVTAEVRIGDFIDPNDITIYRQLAGGVTAANVLHGSANPIGGQNQVIKLRWGSLGEEMKMREAPSGIKFALGENVKRNTSRYPNSRMGVEQLMRDRFEAAILYRQQWDAWSKKPSGIPPRRDLELDAIAEIVEGNRWIHCHSYRQDEILALLRTLEDYEITIGSLQHILWLSLATRSQRASRRPLASRVRPPSPCFWSKADRALESLLRRSPDRNQRTIRRCGSWICSLWSSPHPAGVRK